RSRVHVLKGRCQGQFKRKGGNSFLPFFTTARSGDLRASAYCPLSRSIPPSPSQRIVTMYSPIGAPSFSPYMLTLNEPSSATSARGRGSVGSDDSLTGTRKTNAPAAGFPPTSNCPCTG